MQLKIFSIRDSKGETFNTPFFLKTHGEAERSFSQLANDPKSMIFQYPDDFDLYFIGEFDTQSGTLKTLATAQHLQKGINVRKPSEQLNGGHPGPNLGYLPPNPIPDRANSKTKQQ